MLKTVSASQLKSHREFEKSHLKTVAVIPSYNNQLSILRVVRQALQYVEEVMVIDDGSTDLTAAMARIAGAQVISHPQNRGKGAAMKTAMANIESDIIVFLDGDGQHDPEDIPRLLIPILLGEADFVIGSRFLPGSRLFSHSWLRQNANAAASLMISLIISILQPLACWLHRKSVPRNKSPAHSEYHRSFGYRLLNGRLKLISDCTSGFTAMKKASWHQLHLVSNGFQIETEIIFEQAKKGFTIAETPISCRRSESISHLSIIQDGLSTLFILTRKLIHYSDPVIQSKP